MKKLIILFLLGSLGVHAQTKTAGVIEYKFTFDNLKAIELDTFLTKDQKARAMQTEKNFNFGDRRYNLFFNQEQSLYKAKEEERENFWGSDEFLVQRLFNENKALEIRNISNKNYVVEEEIPQLAWKIKTEIKEVQGYLCMLASTFDPINQVNVEAWFTTEIPVPVGPDYYQGLPGAILEMKIRDGIVNIEAVSIKLNDAQEIPALPKKLKGKRYTYSTFNTEVNKYRKVNASRGWSAWGLRYN